MVMVSDLHRRRHRLQQRQCPNGIRPEAQGYAYYVLPPCIYRILRIWPEVITVMSLQPALREVPVKLTWLDLFFKICFEMVMSSNLLEKDNLCFYFLTYKKRFTVEAREMEWGSRNGMISSALL